MPRLLRWLKKTIAVRLPGVERPVGPSRFLEARFKGSRGSFLDYRLYLPSGSARRDSLPLIVMLHGCRQDSEAFAGGTRMNALAEENRCAVLYPQQSPASNPLRCWNWFESASLEGKGDAGMIAALIAQVTCRRPIDPRRVYVAGMSAGGAMACILALRHSRLFAACAIHSGVMYGAAVSPMRAFTVMQDGPSSASMDAAQKRLSKLAGAVVVPTLVIHGDSDATVNPANADQIIEQLRLRAEAIDPAAGAAVAGAEQRIGKGKVYLRQDFVQQDRIVVRKILIQGLGHAWSGGDPRFEYNDPEGPDASRLILDFAKQYQREVPLALTA
jgi:poly(hydroxyalkanoate) depolymerase family esterase